jgi:S-DNA-T family DNA segregation ATPase FtsK/SpoIIIE
MARTRSSLPRPSRILHVQGRRAPSRGRSREITGIVALGLSIFFCAALLSLQFGDGRFMGPLGRGVAIGGYSLLGVCGYGLALAVAGLALRLLLDREPILRTGEAVSLIFGILSVASLVHLACPGYRVADHAPGGLVGEHLAEVLRGVLSTAGTVLLASVGAIVAVVMATPFRMAQVLGATARGLRVGGRRLARGVRHLGRAARWLVVKAWRGLRATVVHTARFCGEVITAILPERDGDRWATDEGASADDAPTDDDDLAHGDDPAWVGPPIIEPVRTRMRGDEVAIPIVDTSGASANAPTTELAGDTERMDAAAIAHMLATDPRGATGPSRARRTLPGVAAGAAAPTDIRADAFPPIRTDAAAAAGADLAAAPPSTAHQPEIVESQFRRQRAQEMAKKERAAEAGRATFIKLGQGAFQLPPIHLLDYDDSQVISIDHSVMLERSARLAQALSEYGVKGEVTAIRPGPVVTMYEFAPAAGTRLNKITRLTDDLAMSLGALAVRILAPIPGKSVVGFEVPNDEREIVYLKEIIADDEFQKCNAKLPLCLGKDIDGAPVAVDLARMPHLLVAGTTGSGKSVAVNSMITSLLYNKTPDDVRLILVDPKMLELNVYEGIPHLLLPVVTDPKKANLALRWAVDEMERRYDLLATMGVRDIANYNRKVAKLWAKHDADVLQRAADEARRLAEDEEDLEVTEERAQLALALDLDHDEPPEKLPNIVVVIDEFADLMMCAPKDVETSVARIAQKARAAGIHLILATQRPSVDVITGLIKANFPSRIAFQVTAKVDSRTILDQGGAEALLGSGDMLFTDRGSIVRRIHGCYIGEDEIRNIVDFLKTQGKPVYNHEILRAREEDEDGELAAAEDMDEMYDRAVALVAETRQVSISMIQRRLRVGYNRAARMVEHMEVQGVVSPPDGTNRREVLIQPAA